MDTIDARYDRHATSFAETLTEVPDGRWAAPTPCEGWTVRDVVEHVVDTHRTFAGLIDHELTAGPDVDDDPVGAFATAHQATLVLLRDPATADRTYEGPLGVRTYAWAVDTFQTFDLVVHRWDVAQATGRSAPIDPGEADRLLATAESWGEMARAPGVLGPPLTPPEDAGPTTRLLAFLGRRAR